MSAALLIRQAPPTTELTRGAIALPARARVVLTYCASALNPQDCVRSHSRSYGESSLQIIFRTLNAPRSFPGSRNYKHGDSYLALGLELDRNMTKDKERAFSSIVASRKNNIWSGPGWDIGPG